MNISVVTIFLARVVVSVPRHTFCDRVSSIIDVLIFPWCIPFKQQYMAVWRESSWFQVELPVVAERPLVLSVTSGNNFHCPKSYMFSEESFHGM